jgi:pyruvate,orthophosphate dikinase
MVFGNAGDDSLTGVALTRNGTTGENRIEGDYLKNAQGEDVVAGIRQTDDLSQLKGELPDIYAQFEQIVRRLETHYREMQDVEFTVEKGRLWMLQTRSGKRTAQAAVRIAVEMAEEQLISQEEAVLRITPEQVDFFLHPQFESEAKTVAKTKGAMLANGLNVSPGAAVGMVAFDADLAEMWAKEEQKDVIMVRPETKPDDVHGMLAARGILTSRGGRTSHAALVARQFGKPAVVGVSALAIDMSKRQMKINDTTIKEGDWISLDGTAGEVYGGKIKTMVPDIMDPWLIKLLSWADQFRRLGIWTNADNPEDARRARTYGAEGIGLCRTEHMFFEARRLPYLHKMIMSDLPIERREALGALLPFQREDFAGLFRAMDGLPVITRLIDPPLHEFLPNPMDLNHDLTDLKIRLKHADTLEKVDTLLQQINEKEQILKRVQHLHESNPMLGLRGVRLGIQIPELSTMQVRAIFEAACLVAKEGVAVHPEIMIPLTSHVNELKAQREVLEIEAQKVMREQGIAIDYKFGTMIEMPRAALTADQFAEYAQFFSFGTNDLTQTTFGISRDDAEAGFLMRYLRKGILPENPFATLDRDGVGQLMALCLKKARSVKPDLECGICGEHAGDPQSIALCHEIGLTYVSCSPYRVPVARLSAAHAALLDEAACRQEAHLAENFPFEPGPVVQAEYPAHPGKGIGVAAIEEVAVVQPDGRIKGRFRRRRPLQDFFAPVHAHVIVHESRVTHFHHGGIPVGVVGVGSLEGFPVVKGRTRVCGMLGQAFFCPGGQAAEPVVVRRVVNEIDGQFPADDDLLQVGLAVRPGSRGCIGDRHGQKYR